jgi:phosphatidylinositol-4,5-bisphosphate 3-kinase
MDIETEAKVLLAVDPQSRLLYRMDLASYEVAVEETSDLSRNYYSTEVTKVERLLGKDTLNWNFSSPEVERYRRRAIQTHLLQPDPTGYLSYTTTREMSSAYSDITEIRLEVDVSDYMHERFIEPELSEEEEEVSELSLNKSFVVSRSTHKVEMKVCLVTSVSEVLVKLIRMVYNETHIKILLSLPTNQFAFKVKGLRDYMTGSNAVLAYKQVLASMRERELLKVKLVEIPRPGDSFFPPIVKVPGHEAMSKALSYDAPLKPVFMWYPPSILNEMPGDFSAQVKPELAKPRLHTVFSTDANAIRTKEFNDFIKGKPNTPNTLFTGECDWPVRVRVCGVEKLFFMFCEAIFGEATANGSTVPDYITLPDPKRRSKHKTLSKSKSQSKVTTVSKPKSLSKPKSHSFKNLPQGKNRSGSAISHTSSNILFSEISSSHIHHGSSSNILNDAAGYFRLPFLPYLISFEAMLMYGDKVLAGCLKVSSPVKFSYSARSFEWLTFPVKISDLPKETRIGFNLIIHSTSGERLTIGCTAKTLFDELGRLRTGLTALNIWPFYKIEPRLASMEEYWGKTTNPIEAAMNVTSISPGSLGSLKAFEYSQLFVQFDSFTSPDIQWSQRDTNFQKKMYYRMQTLRNIASTSSVQRKRYASSGSSLAHPIEVKTADDYDLDLITTAPTIEDLSKLEAVLAIDPLTALSEEDRRLLVQCREHYKTNSSALILFLRAIDWMRPVQAAEARRILKFWAAPVPDDAVCLLSAEFADEYLRLFAVRHIAYLPDEDLVLYMIQLSQALIFETQHFSPLAEFLLERSLKNPFIVGHAFFWSLRSQLDVKASCERFGVVLEQFLMLCGSFRAELEQEVNSINLFKEVAETVKTKESATDRLAYIRAALVEPSSDILEKFPLPIDSRIQCSSIIPEKCKVMSSKKLPLRLVMKNKDPVGDDIWIIFKTGDDLRQDILTLQLICVMDRIWMDAGLDLRMKPYIVTATQDQVGMIEMVMKSMTITEIQGTYGGVLGAFKKEPIQEYLKDHNPDNETYESSLENFIRSCAGSCVATFLLGIGDRHPGNIMVTQAGQLFHIDFGHFLGNFKSKFGIKRERTPFVLTEEMEFAMGGKDSESFERFKELCCQAYNLVRRQGHRLIYLFKMMISAGMPELSSEEDIEYFRDMLSLHLTDSEASDRFRKEISNSRNNTFRRFDNAIHNLKHAGN